MARRLVVCLDGTGNEIGPNISNVLKLFRITRKNEDQLVYYDPGVGTIGEPGWWSWLKLKIRSFLGLALGYGLDANVLDAYSWLCRNYRAGDEIFLFGFSRGAYTARVLAGFIHLLGLLRPDQLNLCGYALVAYKRASDENDLQIGSRFKRISGSRTVVIRFVGCWDTVASLITPRPDRLYLPQLQTLPFTRTNPSVRTFRHAISIDERRRMFRLNHWKDPQPYCPEPWRPENGIPQDIRQVWFAGVHSDVGGGYPEAESGLAKYPLLWMIGEAEAAGLDIDPAMKARLAEGNPGDSDLPNPYIPPSPTAQLHRSLNSFWWLLEPLPKWYALKEWPRRIVFLFFYIPWAEPRPIPNRPWQGVPAQDPFFVHSSVLARIDDCPDYRPINLPKHFEVESAAGPPPPQKYPQPPYRSAGVVARLRGLLGTWPDSRGWLAAAKALGWLALLLGLLGWLGGFLSWHPQLGPELIKLALIAIIVPALIEELLFRGILLKPPANGVTGLGPAALSALLFAFWHPLQIWFYCRYWPAMCPSWAPLAWNWWFLAACAVLGFACARSVLATRSIWPAVALHWLVIMVWAAFFGGPGAPAWTLVQAT
jgi:uncharacterized protein (DUF2235 family)/membrane protease YdiL (CAAX protease family)